MQCEVNPTINNLIPVIYITFHLILMQNYLYDATKPVVLKNNNLI